MRNRGSVGSLIESHRAKSSHPDRRNFIPQTGRLPFALQFSERFSRQHRAANEMNYLTQRCEDAEGAKKKIEFFAPSHFCVENNYSRRMAKTPAGKGGADLPVSPDARQRVPTTKKDNSLGGASVPASRSPDARTAREDSRPTKLKPSSLLDTRVVYCGDNLEQLAKLPDACDSAFRTPHSAIAVAGSFYYHCDWQPATTSRSCSTRFSGKITQINK